MKKLMSLLAVAVLTIVMVVGVVQINNAYALIMCNYDDCWCGSSTPRDSDCHCVGPFGLWQPSCAEFCISGCEIG